METLRNTARKGTSLLSFVLLALVGFNTYAMEKEYSTNGNASTFFKRLNILGRNPYRLSTPRAQETTHDFISHDGKTLGSVWYRDIDDNTRHVDGFNIYDSKDRGTGKGSICLEEVIDTSIADGKKMITLWANPQAYTFYRRKGFEDCSVSYCDITAKEYLPMKRDLTPNAHTAFDWIHSKASSLFKSFTSFDNKQIRLGPAQHVTMRQELIGSNDKNFGHILYNDHIHDDMKIRYINFMNITDPNDRAQGHGGKFLKKFIQYSEEQGIHALEVAAKRQAYNFWKREGFEGEYTQGTGLIRMQKKLTPRWVNFMFEGLSA